MPPDTTLSNPERSLPPKSPSGLLWLAPAGNFSSPQKLVKSWLKIRQNSKGEASSLRDALAALYPECGIFFQGSGTSALYRVFQLLKSRRGGEDLFVAVSAFTCPDIAAAAVRAGFRLALLDVDAETLDLKFSSLPVAPEKVAAVVLSNLYGFIDSVSPWQELARQNGMLIIDDACQAALSLDGSRRVGGRDETIGVLSFGRGKAFCGSGGGAIVLNKKSATLSPLREVLSAEVSSPSSFSPASLANLLSAMLSWALEQPSLYRLPASMPLLHLGETYYSPAFSNRKILRSQCLVAFEQAESEKDRVNLFSENADAWADLLPEDNLGQAYKIRNLSHDHHTVPIRYPVLLPQGVRERLGTAKQLGLSHSYGKTLLDFPALRSHIAYEELAGAKRLAACLVTLPVHRFVTKEVRAQLTEQIAAQLK